MEFQLLCKALREELLKANCTAKVENGGNDRSWTAV